MKPFLEAGEFVTTHGITGELRLYPWCDDPEFLSGFSLFYLDESGKKSVEAALVRPHKNICIVKLSGVDSIEAARPYIGKTIYIDRNDVNLPEGMHFVQDLLGAAVTDADSGELYGVIRDITRPGRHDVYEVERPDGSLCLFPAVEPFLVSTDAQAAAVTVRPIPGMFDEEPPPAKPKRQKRGGES